LKEAGLPRSYFARLTTADRLSAVVGCVLIVMSLAYLWTEMTYDEAVYMRLARTIAEGGLPLRRVYEDFTQFHLFTNSPPLVLYLAAATQTLFPGNDVPARLLHVVLFVLPTYVMVYWAARVKFGAWAAFASLVVLLTNRTYIRATAHLLLNIPLGLLACLGLLAFHHASSSTVRRRSSLVVVALATALSAWTKYQAVCFAAAIIPYLLYTLVTRGIVGLRTTLLPLLAMVVGGGIGVIALGWFFWASGGPDTVTGTLSLNAGRMSAAAMSRLDVARAMMETARECETTLGGVALLLAAFAMVVEQRHRGLVVILGSYVGATIAFNLAFFRLPGAGTSYLHSAVPAMALLAGPAGVRLVELAATPVARTLVAAAAIGIQLAGSPTWPDDVPRANGSRVAAAYIAAHSPPTAGVMAETVAIEFYSNRPVRPVSFTFPKDVVLRSLDGTSGDDISYVVINAKVPPKNLDAIRQKWDALLAEHFELVPADAPGLHVYRRRGQ
jgi:4-amino-4-deoxy-L-arabinose transferase-like glycosyltransferase